MNNVPFCISWSDTDKPIESNTLHQLFKLSGNIRVVFDDNIGRIDHIMFKMCKNKQFVDTSINYTSDNVSHKTNLTFEFEEIDNIDRIKHQILNSLKIETINLTDDLSICVINDMILAACNNPYCNQIELRNGNQYLMVSAIAIALKAMKKTKKKLTCHMQIDPDEWWDTTTIEII